MLKCKQVELLKGYLASLGGEVRPIDNAEQYKFPCGLLVNVYNTTSVTFQNEVKSEELKQKILKQIESLNA